MIFTVLQYIPILEEDNVSHSTELAKKAKETDSSDDGDSDTDDDITVELSLNDLLDISCQSILSHKIYTKNKIYNYLVENINTPPPKI